MIKKALISYKYIVVKPSFNIIYYCRIVQIFFSIFLSNSFEIGYSKKLTDGGYGGKPWVKISHKKTCYLLFGKNIYLTNKVWVLVFNKN